MGWSFSPWSMLAESDASPFSWLSMLVRSSLSAAFETSVAGVGSADDVGGAIDPTLRELGVVDVPEVPGADGAMPLVTNHRTPAITIITIISQITIFDVLDMMVFFFFDLFNGFLSILYVLFPPKALELC